MGPWIRAASLAKISGSETVGLTRPRIYELDRDVGNISGIAGHQGQIVMERRRCQKSINND